MSHEQDDPRFDKRLALAVVLQAIFDRWLGPASEGQKPYVAKADHASALEFFSEDYPEDLEHWCGVIGLDPQWVREYVAGLNRDQVKQMLHRVAGSQSRAYGKEWK